MIGVRDLVDWIRGVAPSAVDLRLDSREVAPGDVFLAVPGRHHDGRAHIAAAVARGAAAVLADGETGSLQVLVAVPVLEVPGLRGLLGALAAEWYRAPSAGLLQSALPAPTARPRAPSGSRRRLAAPTGAVP